MSPLAERLHGFGSALLDPACPLPPGLVGPDGRPCPKRFAVYRNNVMVGLIEALKANFPAVSRIVGDEFFNAMARAFVMSAPAASPILFDFGVGFPDFVAEFEPAAPLPYLSDVARIERAWSEAFHAPEATALTHEAFADISDDRIADVCFAVHPSLRVVRSHWPALTIWRMNVGDGMPGPVDLESGGEDALVVRPDAEVEVRSMPSGAAAFIGALADGRTLVDAAGTAKATDAGFDLTAHLAGLIGGGIFVGYRSAGNPRANRTRESAT